MTDLQPSNTELKRWLSRTKPGRKFRGWRMSRVRRRRLKFTLKDAATSTLIGSHVTRLIIDEIGSANEILEKLPYA